MPHPEIDALPCKRLSPVHALQVYHAECWRVTVRCSRATRSVASLALKQSSSCSQSTGQSSSMGHRIGFGTCGLFVSFTPRTFTWTAL